MLMLQSSVSHEADRVVVALEGELDCSNEDELKQLLRSVMGDQPCTVVVDLAAVTFMDSSGLRCLLEAAEHASSCDSQLLVQRPSGIVRRVLDLTGTYETLTTNVIEKEVRGQSVGS